MIECARNYLKDLDRRKMKNKKKQACKYFIKAIKC